MRIFRFWATYKRDLVVEGQRQPSQAIGGSNYSMEDALADARRKLDRVQGIIDGTTLPDEDYEVNIVEEIIDKIDEENIVTRNRYGALVLNSTNLMFIDVDEYIRGLWDFLFYRHLTRKDLMLRHIQKRMRQPQYAGYGFRVYETYRGVRIMVINTGLSPRSPEAQRMMKDFQADLLYKWMCIRQNCYRARLTPKPYRIKHKSMKVIFPHRTQAQNDALSAWIRGYNQKSNGYATCRLIDKYGTETMNRVIAYHDMLTKIQTEHKLA